MHELNFENKVNLDEVVLVKGPPMTKRPFWHLGRVVELIPGYDGKVRSVKIKKGDGSITHHSVKHLYPMELSLTHAYTATGPQGSLAPLNAAPADIVVETGSAENLMGPIRDAVVDNPELSIGAETESLRGDSVEPEIYQKVVTDIVETMVAEELPYIEEADASIASNGTGSSLKPAISTVEPIEQDSEFDFDKVEPMEQDPDVALTSRRSRRVVPARNKPMDDEYIFY